MLGVEQWLIVMVEYWKDSDFPECLQGQWQPVNAESTGYPHRQGGDDRYGNQQEIYQWDGELQQFSHIGYAAPSIPQALRASSARFADEKLIRQ
jgi:hypothetical protein